MMTTTAMIVSALILANATANTNLFTDSNNWPSIGEFEVKANGHLAYFYMPDLTEEEEFEAAIEEGLNFFSECGAFIMP